MAGKGQPKGTPKPKASGRKKGVPNKITFELMQTLREMNFDPAVKLLQLAMKAEKAHDRVGVFHENSGSFLKAAIEATGRLSRMVYPDRKATDITTGGDKLQPVSFTDFVRDVVAKETAKNKP